MNRKKLYFAIASFCILLVLSSVIWWSYKQLSLHEKSANIDLYELVPRESKAILETHDVHTLLRNIRHSSFNQEYETLHISDLIDYLSEGFEEISSKQAHGLSTGMNQLLVSFHHPDTPQDQVIYGRINDSDKAFIQELMLQGNKAKHSPKSFSYKGEEIIIYPIGNQFLACYFQPGCFAVSLQEKLIEKVIDSYQEKTSVGQDKSFQALHQQRKRTEPLTLYIREGEKSKQTWTEYDIRMNAESIYLTSGHSLPDTCQIFGNSVHTQPPIDQLTATELPANIHLMYQLPFTLHGQQADANMSPATLESILDAYSCKEIDILLFTPQQAPQACRQLLLIPLTESAVAAIRQTIRYHESAKRKSGLWIQGKNYPVWLYNGESSLHPYFCEEPAEDAYYLTFYKEKMLVATDMETLGDYLTEISSYSPNSGIDNRKLYEFCLNDLAEQANFTLIADMNGIMENESTGTMTTKLLPEFFFKHKEFFKNFMFSTQYIYADGQISTNLILTYQGDSILWRKMGE